MTVLVFANTSNRSVGNPKPYPTRCFVIVNNELAALCQRFESCPTDCQRLSAGHYVRISGGVCRTVLSLSLCFLLRHTKPCSFPSSLFSNRCRVSRLFRCIAAPSDCQHFPQRWQGQFLQFHVLPTLRGGLPTLLLERWQVLAILSGQAAALFLPVRRV